MRAIHYFMSASLALLIQSEARAQQVLEGTMTDVVLNGSNEIYNIQNLRCRKLTINGPAQIKSAAQPDKYSTPETVSIACDEVYFSPNAQLRIFSNLQMWAGALSGSLQVVGMRNRAGADAPNFDQRAKDGNTGSAAAAGPDGSNAHGPGFSIEYPGGKSSSAGGNGGTGSSGTSGAAGQPGTHGMPGENNVSIVVHMAKFSAGAGCPAVTLLGGPGGKGGNGQPGGNGGAGGPGGNGGKGGDAAVAHDGSRGGSGGAGGAGGDGGNGGVGGNGGRGGDGGRIELIVAEAAMSTIPNCTNLVEILKNEGGRGGNPGVGGPGGTGGPGGAGGRYGRGGDGSVFAGIVRNDGGRDGYDGVSGQKGQDGKPGKPGLFGEDGLKGEIKENLFGRGVIANVTPVDWNHLTH